jgi:integrase
MKPATILRIHSIISSALDLAVRYDWADRNVAKYASPPHPRKREPDPPSPDQAARLLNLVWAEDEEFGLYLWTAFTTGARRGEVSALRENRFDFTRQQVRLARNYLVKQRQHIEKAPKDGEGRVLSLDLLTYELFQERFQRRRAEAQALGVQVPEDAFAFSCFVPGGFQRFFRSAILACSPSICSEPVMSSPLPLAFWPASRCRVTDRPAADVPPCRNDSQPLLAGNAVWGPLMIPS